MDAATLNPAEAKLVIVSWCFQLSQPQKDDNGADGDFREEIYS